MKFITNKQSLLTAVQMCLGEPPEFSAPPHHIRIVAGDCGAWLVMAEAARSTSVAMREVESIEPGECVVDAGSLHDLAHAAPVGALGVAIEDERLVFRSARAELSLSVSWPAPAAKEPLACSPLFALPAQSLAVALGRVFHAVSKDEIRAHVNSVLFEACPSLLRLVATDGHRLAIAEVPLRGPEEASSFLIRRDDIATLMRVLCAADGPVEVRRDGEWSQWDFGAGNRCMLKPVGAVFPPYASVIPQKTEQIATVQREALLSLARSAARFCNLSFQVMRLFVLKNVLAVEVNRVGTESLAASIDINATWETAAAFHPPYLCEALEAFPPGEVEMQLGDELDPIVLRAPGFMTITMPAREP